MNENLKDILENLIALHEMEAPLEKIDEAIFEARRLLDE